MMKFTRQSIKSQSINVKLDESVKVHQENRTATDDKTKIRQALRCFKNRANLIGQWRNAGELFQCNICNESYKNKLNLYKHYRIHFGKKDTFHCDACNKSLTSATSLDIHYRTHNKEKSHTSGTGDNTSSNQSTQGEHSLIRTNEKGFLCGICFKTFREQSKLKKHYLTHTNAKLFKCDLCDQQFVRKVYLNAHYLSHAEEKNVGDDNKTASWKLHCASEDKNLKRVKYYSRRDPSNTRKTTLLNYFTNKEKTFARSQTHLR